MNHVQALQILLVEDDDIDAMAFERHLGNSDLSVCIHRVIDGTAALDLLRDSAKIGNDAPFVIVLDLNMPRMTGIEFLEEMRGDPELKHHIVFVFTTSDAAKDRKACFNHNVAGYVLKSRAGERFRNLVQLIESYVNVAEFPPYSSIES